MADSSRDMPHSDNLVVAQTWPPLGQVTTCNDPTNTISLTAILEVPLATPKEQCQLSIWHSIDGAAWTESPLSAAPDPSHHQYLSPRSESTTQLYFVSSAIPLTLSLQFTLKFRLNKNHPWRWIRDEHHIDDGHVLVLPPYSAFNGFQDVMLGLNSAWAVSDRVSQSPGTQLWSLKTAVPGATGTEPAYLNVPLGSPWSSFLRWFALVRTSVSWLAPRQGRTECFLDKGAVLLSFINHRGQSLAILPVCQTNVQPLLQHTGDGHGVSVHVQNDSSSEEFVTVVAAAGNSFENAVAAVMYEARSLGEKQQQRARDFDDARDFFSSTFRPACEGPWYDGLGYCTWNALGQQLTEQKLLDALGELERQDIRISNLIIDDNWQSLDYQGATQFQHGWMGFEAEPSSFPSGLKATVSEIKQKHPSIQNVSVWHAIIGYWGGISPRGTIAQSYKTTQVARRDGDHPDMALGDTITVVAKDDILRLYQDFYQFLADSGIDGVKVDAQYMLDMLKDAPDRRDLTNAYLDAWSIASLKHFNFKTISCMSMIPQSLFHALLPRSNRPFQLRNSDDYFPHVPSSHPWHVWTNAHNAIFSQYLNVIPDWDMFQTKMDYAAFHAAARCVSGGPICITDFPGQHDMNLISQITATTVQGSTIVLRPKGSARALQSYTGYEDNLLLKVGTYHGVWGAGTSIVALFNISRQSLTELIHLSSFPGTVENRSYVIRAHTTGRISAPMKLLALSPSVTPSTGTAVKSTQSVIATSIGVGGFEILCAFPVSSFADSLVSVANLGLVGKMTGGAAIESTKIELRENNSISIKTELKALGVLGIYISALASMTIQSSLIVLLNDRMVPQDTVSISSDEPEVLEVDVETAWKKMGLKPSHGDSFKVEIICPS